MNNMDTIVKIEFRCHHQQRPGVALLVVLLIVMAVTVLSLGFLTRSNADLACGANMALRIQNDYLAESALEHAKGLILNPQEVESEYWSGAARQQLVAGSDDYYDVQVLRLGPCNYQITSQAYRERNGQEIGRSTLQAQLRLDPCIAFWTENDARIWPRVTVSGDVYCTGLLTNDGMVNGDAFVTSLNGTVAGRTNTPDQLSLQWPQTAVADFTSHYVVQPIATSLCDVTLGPYSPPRVCFYGAGDVLMSGSVSVGGMLAVDGSLTVRGSDNVIRADKNLPAILVTGNLVIEDGAALDVHGLVLVEGQVRISAGVTDVNIAGALFTKGGVFETTADSSPNDNAGLIYDRPTWRPSGGRVDGALEFDGMDDYVQTPDEAGKLQLTGDYTMSVWLKADAVQQNWAGIFSKRSADGATNHWALQFNNVSPKKLVVTHTTSSWDTGITLGDLAGDWHNVMVVRNGQTMTSHLDANEVHSNIWNENPAGGTGHLDIGAVRTDSSAYYYKGLIDDLIISPDANGVDPLGYWKLDEQTGGTINITADPAAAAVVIWPAGVETNWGPAVGALLRSINRN